MKKTVLIILFIGLLISISSVLMNTVGASSTLGEKVTVVTPIKINTLDKELRISEPDLKVTINGIDINDPNAVHPIICYNDIIYFPLDWIYSNWLGIDISIGNNDEIIIDNTGKVNSFVSWNYEKVHGAGSSFEIKDIEGIITNKIIINGREIDNISETYPLLKYFDCKVYIPLTWKWVVNEFGWTYSWDVQSGLIINTHKDRNTYDRLLQTQILSKINEFTYKKSAYIKVNMKALKRNRLYQVNLKKETLGIQERLNRSNYNLITESYSNCYFETQPIDHENNRSTIVNETLSTVDNGKNREPIIIEGTDVNYEVYGYTYCYTLEHEYEGKVSDISVDGKSYLDDLHIVTDKVQREDTVAQHDNIYQSLRNAGYIHEETPEYILCDNLLKFEFLSQRNKILSFEKIITDHHDEVYKIEYETKDRNYINPRVISWDEDTYINQPIVSTKKTALVTFKEGDISQIIINDGKFEYDMSITVYNR